MGIGVIVIERRWPPPAEFATLCLLGLGVGLALWDGTIVGSPFASLCCMTGAACHTAVIYFAGKVWTSAYCSYFLLAARLLEVCHERLCFTVKGSWCQHEL